MHPSSSPPTLLQVMFAEGVLQQSQATPDIAAILRATLEGASAAAAAAGGPAAKAELFYTPASEALYRARQAIAALSFERAAQRLQRERDALAAPQERRDATEAETAALIATVRRLAPIVSQVRHPRVTGEAPIVPQVRRP